MAPTAAHIFKSSLPTEVEAIDVDAIEDSVSVLNSVDKRTQTHPRTHLHGCSSTKCICKGILIRFPDGKDEHTSYPFGLHKERTMPWNYQSIDDSFYIQAKSCQKWSSESGKACQECHNLTSSTLYTGIMHRIVNGTHENAPLTYHGIGGLVSRSEEHTS